MSSYLKLRKPPDAVLLAFGISALLLIILSTAWGFRHIPPTKAQVEKELAEITPPPAAGAPQHTSVYKITSGTVGNCYQANLTYDQIRAYYDTEAARHGWKFLKHVPLTSWGKDLGESETTYCRGNHALNIYFTGTAALGYRYCVSVTWGWDDCT